MNSAFFWLFGFSFLVFSQTQTAANSDESSQKTNSSKSRSLPKLVLSPSRVQQQYITYCTHCHGMDGRPTLLVEDVMPEIPDFSRIQWGDYEKQHVISSIADATGQMPSFNKVMTKTEIEALAEFIAKFPVGKPFSIIEKSSRYRKADAQLIQRLADLEDRFRSIRNSY